MARYVIRNGRRVLDTTDPLLSPPYRDPVDIADDPYRRCLGCNRPIVPTINEDEAVCSDICARQHQADHEEINQLARDLAQQQQRDQQRRRAA